MDAQELKELEDNIDVKVEKVIGEVQQLEWLVNQQTDLAQRHTDQALIHDIVQALFALQTDRPDH